MHPQEHADELAKINEQLKRAAMELRGDLTVDVPRPAYTIPRDLSIIRDRNGKLYLQWSWADAERAEYEDDQPPRGALDRFIRFYDAENDAERIRAFGTQYGVLEVCPHRRLKGEPGSRWCMGLVDCLDCAELFGVRTAAQLEKLDLLEIQLFRSRSRLNFEYSVRMSSPRGHGDIFPPPPPEPLEAWIFYARQLRTMLTIMADLRDGKLPSHKDWETVSPTVSAWLEYVFSTEPGETRLCRAARWYGLARAVNDWIGTETVTETYLRRRGDEGFLRFGLRGIGLRGLLATELAATLCSPEGVWRCDRCHEPYAPGLHPEDPTKRTRTPRQGQRHFCWSCRQGEYKAIKADRARQRYREVHPVARRRSKYDRAATGESPKVTAAKQEPAAGDR